MKHVLLTALFILGSHSVYASQKCEDLTLTCTANFATLEGSIHSAAASFQGLQDENWDEPSLQNCAATVYLYPQNLSTVRVAVSKDLKSNSVSLTATAIQTQDTTEGRGVKYANTVRATSSLGTDTLLPAIVFAQAIQKQDAVIGSAYLTCVVK